MSFSSHKTIPPKTPPPPHFNQRSQNHAIRAFSSNDRYPLTQKIEHTDNYFGTIVADPYRWLENDTSDAVKQFVATQRAFTEDYLSKIPFRAAILHRLKQIVNFSRGRNGWKVGEYIFFAANNGLQNQSVYYYQKGLTGTPKVFLDPNTLSKDGSVSVSLDLASFDKKYIAWHINRNGSDWSVEYITEIATRRQLKDSLPWMKGGDVAWYKDGLFYSRYPVPDAATALTAAAVNQKVYYHKLGDPLSADKLVFEDPAHPETFVFPQTLEGGHHLVIVKATGTSGDEVICRDLTGTDTAFATIFPGYDFQNYVIAVDGDKFLAMTNDGADRFRLISIDPRHAERSQWKDIIPQQSKTTVSLADYTTEQVFYPGKDGTKIPMFLVHKKGLVPDRSHPVLLYAYGGFDVSITPYFSIVYSPLHNIRSATAYPATMVITADYDDRVVPMHSFKFGASLQEKQSGPNPILIRITGNQGHGASGSSLQKAIEQQADILSFMFYNMGITPNTPASPAHPPGTSNRASSAHPPDTSRRPSNRASPGK